MMICCLTFSGKSNAYLGREHDNLTIIALHLLYKLWISNILATSITEETCIVKIRIWCKKIGTVNFIIDYKPCFVLY